MTSRFINLSSFTFFYSFTSFSFFVLSFTFYIFTGLVTFPCLFLCFLSGPCELLASSSIVDVILSNNNHFVPWFPLSSVLISRLPLIASSMGLFICFFTSIILLEFNFLMRVYFLAFLFFACSFFSAFCSCRVFVLFLFPFCFSVASVLLSSVYVLFLFCLCFHSVLISCSCFYLFLFCFCSYLFHLFLFF